MDRAVKAAEEFKLGGSVEKWRKLRDEIHEQVCREGFNQSKRAFVQFYGSDLLDASLLMIPLVGFLPPAAARGPARPRHRAGDRARAVARRPGRPLRHQAGRGRPAARRGRVSALFVLDGRADNYYLQGRTDDARQMFEHLLSLCNDVWLLAEEYDPRAKRLVGNFPQAFSHVGLVNTAYNLSPRTGPAEHRLQS
jgi:GH15 family glucan-1,4-alpha-glucosidase